MATKQKTVKVEDQFGTVVEVPVDDSAPKKTRKTRKSKKNATNGVEVIDGKSFMRCSHVHEDHQCSEMVEVPHDFEGSAVTCWKCVAHLVGPTSKNQVASDKPKTTRKVKKPVAVTVEKGDKMTRKQFYAGWANAKFTAKGSTYTPVDSSEFKVTVKVEGGNTQNDRTFRQILKAHDTVTVKVTKDGKSVYEKVHS